MSFSDVKKAQKYASIAEVAAAQAKLSESKLADAPNYAEQARQSAEEALSYKNSAQESSDSAASSSASAGNYAAQSAEFASQSESAAQAVFASSVHAPVGESLTTLPAAENRQNKALIFNASGDNELRDLNTFASLDSGGKIPVSQIPAIALTEPFVVSSQSQMLALNAQVGDIAKRTDLGYSFCLASLPSTNIANWVQLTDDVLSQLGQPPGATMVGATSESGESSNVQIQLDAKASKASLAAPGGVGLVNGAAKQADVDTLNIHSSGYVNILEYIPANLHQYLSDFTQSQTNAGDLITYLNSASAYCETNHKDLVFPFGYYFVSNTFMLPAGVKVIGLGYPYILSLSPFNSSNIIVSCDKTGQPTYDMDMFHINGPGTSNLNMVGLRVGGCRNSKFSRIIITSCFSAGVEVYPTVSTSGDVENVQLDHVWTVLSGGVRFKANSSISRGNITDATVSNCQLTTGDATTSGNPAITITGATGKQIFGIAFKRVFTQTTDTDHIVINPNGGSVFHNTFSDISGESWTIASGGISNSFAKNALYVLDGAFTANAFRDFYKQSLPGNGITLGIGSSGNLFDGLRFTDRNVVGFNNKWLTIPSGANSNSFHACYFDGSFNRADSGYGGVAANYVFRANDGKISDLSGSTKFDTPEIRDVSPVLIKRATIFAISGNQLVNYPVTGCAFATTSDGISVAVPAGSTAYLLTIPFTPTAGFSGKFIGFTIKYVCGAMNGMTLSADICGTGSSITDLTSNKANVFSMYGAYNSANKTVTLTFGGNRTAQANMTLQDIIITEGANIPYIPNFRKIYIES